MKRKCSVCKEKGHDKRQCPIEREKIKEEITFKRERINLLFAKVPELLANPVFMGLVWFQLSRNNKVLSKANTYILAGDVVGLNVPEGATLGALIQKAQDALPKAEQLSEDIGEGIGAATVPAEALSGLVKDFLDLLGLKDYEPPVFTTQ